MVKLADITPEQANTAKVLSDIAFKGLALLVLLALLVGGCIAFGYALFKLNKPVAESILGAMDLLLGVLLRQVYKSLFPAA